MMKSLIFSSVLLCSSFCGYTQVMYEPNVTVTTFAGATTPGHADGQGTAAGFYHPYGIAVDAAGNVYVTDSRNYLIRKITPEGLVSTLAGSTTSGGSVDGQGAAAGFNGPSGIDVDASGNVYVADQTSSKIRKITPGGLVSTLAGSGSWGSADGQGAAARFNVPADVAADANGNVYVADYSNNEIRKITPEGLVSTFAGSTTAGYADGQGTTAAAFNTPSGIAIDASGNIYVSDYRNNCIRKITADGMVSTFAGSATPGNKDGQGTAARFKGPYGIAVDASGNVYVADYGNNAIRRITSDGMVSTLAGSSPSGYADGQGSAAKFSSNYDIAVDHSGNIYVTDYDNNVIRKITIASVPTALLNDISDSAIAVFPNPVKDVLHITLPSEVTGTASLSDMYGNVVFTQPVKGKQLQLSNVSLSNGIYIVHVFSDHASYLTRVVIAK